MRRACVAGALLVLAACGGGPPIPDEDLLLHVTLGAEEVAPGEGVPVTVVRVWSKDLEPAAFEERALAPLVLRLERTHRREDARRVEETRRYRGYAMSRTDVTVPPAKLTARPKAGGPERSTSSPRLRLRVKPAVDATSPGKPEEPGAPLAEPQPRWPWFAGGAVAFLALLAWSLRRRAPAVPRMPPPSPAAQPDALARLRAVDGDVARGADVLRDHVGARWGVRTRERTSEEALIALEPLLGAEPRARLAALLAAGDRVKFGAEAPAPAARAEWFAQAERFVAGTGGA